MELVIGIDTGGTFTDCVAIAEDGRIVQAKAFTTPSDLAVGFLEALSNMSTDLEKPIDSILPATRVLAHGTTTGLNALLSRAGARVGLITTRGHEDAILIGRVHQKVAGLSEREIADVARLAKARPLVARPMIRGVTERVDHRGKVLVPLDIDEMSAIVEELLGAGAESIAVSLLWSFLNPSHEQGIRRHVLEVAPDIPISISSEVAPLLGEYERTATTVINAYLTPVQRDYVASLNARLQARGLPRPLLMMQSAGGVITSVEAGARPVELLFSGPVGGVVGARAIGRSLGVGNIITADVGGTSFDVGLVVDGDAPLARLPIVEKYHVLSPTVDIVSIGAGGGSVASVEPLSGRLEVGPRSTGSVPGPACYGAGGTEATVTDADLVLGRLSPDRFFGGRRTLSLDLAETAITTHVADPLGMDTVEAALGICAVADSKMGDLVRRVSLERGLDPRDFVVFAFGGAGPLHVGAFAREVGVKQAIVSPLAPVLSAFGMATADLLRVYARSEPMLVPPDLATLNDRFRELAAAAAHDVAGMGIPSGDIVLAYGVDLKFRRQTHSVTVPIAAPPLTEATFEEALVRFEQLYERTFGRGAGYRQAGIELSTLRLRAVGMLPKPQMREHTVGDADSRHAQVARRPVTFDIGTVETPVYEMERLHAGNEIAGPAVIEAAATALIVHPGQVVNVDRFLNMVLDLSEAG